MCIEPIDDPAEMWSKGISDHSPVRICFKSKSRVDPKRRPIHPEVCKHPHFKALVSHGLQQLPLDTFGVWRRHAAHKTHIRVAAAKVRNFLLQSEPESLFARHQTFASMARSVWTQDVSLANTLMLQSPPR